MEKLLVFGVTDTEYAKIKQIASRMKLRCEQFSSACHAYTLEQLLTMDAKIFPEMISGGAQSTSAASSGMTSASESLLVICGLADKRVDKLLFELRKSDVKLNYKAILTPTNRKWTVSQLLLEMHREKAAYQRMQP